MVPPIVINENGDVAVYATAEAAARALEPIDVLNNEYIAYDSEGYVLRLVAGAQLVSISGRAPGQPDPDALAKVLRTYLHCASDEPVPIEIGSVSQLLACYVERFGYEP